jgi:hypothetical protein
VSSSGTRRRTNESLDVQQQQRSQESFDAESRPIRATPTTSPHPLLSLLAEKQKLVSDNGIKLELKREEGEGNDLSWQRPWTARGSLPGLLFLWGEEEERRTGKEEAATYLRSRAPPERPGPPRGGAAAPFPLCSPPPRSFLAAAAPFNFGGRYRRRVCRGFSRAAQR